MEEREEAGIGTGKMEGEVVEVMKILMGGEWRGGGGGIETRRDDKFRMREERAISIDGGGGPSSNSLME